jgi:hypothetical protein
MNKETWTNSLLYFEMAFRECKDRVLPKNFDPNVYREMHNWLKHKPTMNPPYFCDNLNPNDGNLWAPQVCKDEVLEGNKKQSMHKLVGPDATPNI